MISQGGSEVANIAGRARVYRVHIVGKPCQAVRNSRTAPDDDEAHAVLYQNR